MEMPFRSTVEGVLGTVLRRCLLRLSQSAPYPYTHRAGGKRVVRLDDNLTLLHPWPDSGSAWTPSSLLGPPLPSGWPRPRKRILLHADNGDAPAKPRRPWGAGPHKPAMQAPRAGARSLQALPPARRSRSIEGRSSQWSPPGLWCPGGPAGAPRRYG